MEQVWFSAAVWLGLALLATLLSIWLRLDANGRYQLIVLGRRGHSPVEHWLVGSTTDRIVDPAPCAVLIVP